MNTRPKHQKGTQTRKARAAGLLFLAAPADGYRINFRDGVVRRQILRVLELPGA